MYSSRIVGVILVILLVSVDAGKKGAGKKPPVIPSAQESGGIPMEWEQVYVVPANGNADAQKNQAGAGMQQGQADALQNAFDDAFGGEDSQYQQKLNTAMTKMAKDAAVIFQDQGNKNSKQYKKAEQDMFAGAQDALQDTTHMFGNFGDPFQRAVGPPKQHLKGPYASSQLKVVPPHIPSRLHPTVLHPHMIPAHVIRKQSVMSWPEVLVVLAALAALSVSAVWFYRRRGYMALSGRDSSYADLDDDDTHPL